MQGADGPSERDDGTVGDRTVSLEPPRSATLLIVAFDVVGAMPLFIARMGRISKVYTCSDHFVDKLAKVDQMWCQGKTIAVQLNTGDLRHIEFVLDDEPLSLTDVPMEA